MFRDVPMIALSFALGACLLIAIPAVLLAQDIGVAIEPNRLPLADQPVIARAEELQQAGKLMDLEQVVEALKSPASRKLDLPDPAAEPLAPRRIASRARRALLRIGWFYKCPRCHKWHVNFANGYAITADGAAATCYHVIAPDTKAMREGYLVALDADGNVLPVTAVLAADKHTDVAIVQVDAKQLLPLPLNDRVAPGDPVYLYSDPKHVAGYFSTGIVNRFFWRTAGQHPDPQSLEAARDIRMHVSTDWAPGSSGAPILDAAGNAIGHVAMIASLQDKIRTIRQPSPRGDDKNQPDDQPNPEDSGKPDERTPDPIALRVPGPTVITLHEAVPARAVKLLAQSAAKPHVNSEQ